MAKWQEGLNDSYTHLWRLYEEGLDFQNRLGLRSIIPMNINFFEGNQWPSPTENTKNLPRPVVNIVKMICRSKKSAILSTPVRIQYKSYSQGTDVEKFNSFAESILKEIGQDKLDKIAVDDGVKKGSYFYHYYWDSQVTDLRGRIEGGVRCEIIDPLNIFFSNPESLDEQAQKWIIISSKRKAEEILPLCDSSISYDEINADADESGNVILLTRYFRIDGEVYFERGTRSRIISKPHMIAPDIAIIQNSNIFENSSTFSGFFNSNHTKSYGDDDKEEADSLNISYSVNAKVRAHLYPVVSGYYEKKEGSIYGLSEIEGLIPNQKAINFNIAMSLLNAQECAWGKYIALPNALKGQKISNIPGQVLIDHSGTGEGIKKMNNHSLSSLPMEMSTTLVDITRNISGASELMNGETLWANMSGAAIAQLQAQAQLPIEELKSEFWEVKRKQGMVLMQFLKLHYYHKEFIRKIIEDGTEKEVFDVFTSDEYKDSLFDVYVQVSGGAKSNLASDISVLDSCLKEGKISLETYIKCYPDSAISNKAEILRLIKEEKQSELFLLKEELSKIKSSTDN